MRQLLIKISIIFSLFVTSFSSTYAAVWRLDKDENGIKIYTRAVQGSPIREIKGEVMIDASLDSIMAVFNDLAHYPSWNHQCTKVKLLKSVNVSERYHYQNINMPFPVADRDLLIHAKTIQSGDKVYVHLNAVPNFCKNSILKACDAVNQSKNIMVNKLKGVYELTPNKKGGVKVVWTQHTEPAGKLPSWLVNNLLIDVPFNTLLKLRKQATSKQYKDVKMKRDASGRILGF